MRTPAALRAAGWLALLVLVLGGCGAAEVPGPGPTGPAATSAPVSVPADGVLLRSLGYVFGPVEAFSLPRASRLTATVDQADNVTVVLSDPPADEVAGYLRRTLPGAGFTVTADDPGRDSLTFSGHGWAGSFTGRGPTSAVLLRPRPGS